MRYSENYCVLIGKAGGDPKMGQAGETPVATLSLATSEGYKDKSGQWQDRTTWHYIKVFGKDAQAFVDQVRKGDTVTVIGKIDNRTTGEGDQRKTFSSVVARTFMVSPKPVQGQQDPQTDYPAGW